ncbi:MAG: MauE/DoxX family redox-associated membrane protein [Fidelibacterota bacterium]
MEIRRVSGRRGAVNFLGKSWVVVAFRVILGGMLMVASFDKIVDPASFQQVISNYQMIPYAYTNLLAIVLPWLELYVGACLIVGIFVDGASFLTMGLMLVFIVALSQATLRGLDIECGCFKGASKVGIRRIVEDVVWFAMAYIVWRRPGKPWEVYPKPVLRSPTKDESV